GADRRCGRSPPTRRQCRFEAPPRDRRCRAGHIRCGWDLPVSLAAWRFVEERLAPGTRQQPPRCSARYSALPECPSRPKGGRRTPRTRQKQAERHSWQASYRPAACDSVTVRRLFRQRAERIFRVQLIEPEIDIRAAVVRDQAIVLFADVFADLPSRFLAK